MGFIVISPRNRCELSKYQRNDNRVDLGQLLKMGQQYQAAESWEPKQEKNRGKPKPKVEVQETVEEAAAG